ncbi:phage portal protein [Oceanicella actignis]|uniref:Phage portal protein, lambda family n=1 Tax=Oceanicella actignis TaxID=1189325 RepID=A0A1M7U252_9RHOB|nr:phage portal protein [Oceanicella actignis]SES76583.1 phage portal protein, lambda family [Oceanicella actignis]SHN76957.1 phage portal protein, lambda family [Oceanicella actignis]
MKMPRFLRRTPAPPRIEPAVADAPPAPRAAGATPARGARKFMAARPDRLAGGFGAGALPSTRATVRQDLRGLIAHARHAAQNIDYVRAFEMMVRRHVVGRRGIALQSQAKGADGARDMEAARAIESAWAEWGARRNCTTCGRLSWWNVENIAATMVAREGNFLMRAHTGPGFGPFGFQVEVLPIDLVDLDRVEALRGGAYIDGGIEFDPRGRPVALHLWSAHPGEHHHGRRPRRIRVPMDEVIHVFRPTESLQALGVPSSHTALRRFNMLGRYEEAALTAAHFGAANMAWIKESLDGEGPPDGDAAADDLPEEIEAGMVARLPPGMDVASWAPNYPDGEMPAFAKHMLKGGAAGLGVSYSGLSNDLEGANFSSLRAGLGEERDEWRMFQRDLYEGLHSEVFRMWLPRAILSGRLSLPMADMERLRPAAWRPRGWPSVNPKDDATAADSDLRNRLRAPSDIVADRGDDFADVAERFAADLETMRRAGVPLPEALAGQAQPAGENATNGEPE